MRKLSRKKLLCLLLVIVIVDLLASCGRYDLPHKGTLATICRLSSSNEDDSAMTLLQRYHPSPSAPEGDRALYALLMTKTRYRLDLPALPDSLIDNAIHIFKTRARNDSLLADAWFYKGAIACDTGHVSQYSPAVQSLQQAMAIAEKHQYVFLLDKVYEKLSNINLFSRQYSSALDYAQRLDRLAERSGNQYLRACASHQLLAVYYQKGQQDSARFFAEECYKLKSYMPANELPSYLNDMYMTLGPRYRKEAIKVLDSLIKEEPDPTIMGNLACLYDEDGNHQLADSLWSKALKTRDLSARVAILQDMISHKQTDKQWKEVAALSRRLIIENDSLNIQLQHNNIQAVQDNFVTNQYQQGFKHIGWLTAAIAVLVILSILALYLWRRHRDEARRQLMLSEVEKMKAVKDELLRKKTTRQEFIPLMDHALEKLKAKHAMTFSHGRELYEDIRKNRSTVNWRKSDFIDFIDYYMSVDLDFVSEVVKKWHDLTPSEMFYLILEHEGRSEEEIKDILGISDTALRVRKSRLRKKMIPLILVLVVMGLSFTSCHNQSRTSTTLDSLQVMSMHNEDDSVMSRLQRIDTTSLSDEGDKALFNLLNAKTRFRLSVSPNPTEPLKRSLAYFSHNNDSLLADTYYYIGAMMSDTCKISDYRYAIPYLKKAEAIGLKHHYYFILDKVYERIANINLVSDNAATAHAYAHKIMGLAEQSHSDYLRALGYYALMSTHYHVGDKDSTQYFAEKAFNSLHFLPMIERPHIIADIYAIADTQLKRKLQRQMEMLDARRPSPIVEANLAVYYQESGNKAKADSLWSKALKTNDLRMKSDILKCMILQLQDGGNNEKIAALSMQLAKVNNQLNQSLQSNNIQQVQDHIDRESVYQKLKGKLLHLLIIEVVVLCLIVALLLWRRKRSREKTARLIDEELQFQTQLQSMTSTDQSEESEMDKRQRGLMALKDRHEQLSNAGEELYERWKTGESVKDWKKDDFISLIDYYMSIDIDFVKSLNNDYEGLTPSEMFFLILEHEGESQETITATFDISPTAYRLKKSRIKKKAKA